MVAVVWCLSITMISRVDGAVKGNGTSGSPYIVKKESELREAISLAKKDTNVYIALEGTVTITNILKIEKGIVHINAKGAARTIKKSTAWNEPINDVSEPRKMIRISNGAKVIIGESGYTLSIVGARNAFPDGRQQNDTFCVDVNSSLTLDSKSVLKDAQNSMMNDESSPVRVYGNFTLRGEITNCYGGNGGAIKNLGGIVNIEEGAYIHNCYSYTEGGAIYVGNKGTLNMDGDSRLVNNFAEEEGGAIFVTNESECKIYDGVIYQNTAGKSSGGIFSGYGSKLIIGLNGNGPVISSNKAAYSGGGVRCNGGTGKSGGSAMFRGGTITQNEAGDNGGGISIGSGSSTYKSVVVIKDMFINKNTSASYGGGVYLPSGVEGGNGSSVNISNTTISNNTSNSSGGGIFLSGNAELNSHNIIQNKATQTGGGLCIVESGKATIDDGTISGNYATKGSGIYQKGLLEFKKNAFVNNNNIVFLCKGHHIDVVEALQRTSGYISRIDAEITSPGEIVVDVTYNGGNGATELYYSGTPESERKGETVSKKFVMVNDIPLRYSVNVVGIANKRYIVISRKYSIKYHSNSLDPVDNMPGEEIGFWKEYVDVASPNVSRAGFLINKTKTWNTAVDGKGVVYSTGKLLVESNIDLYAIWNEIAIKELFMSTKDRYYAVKQNIILDRDELTRKVNVTNDLNTAVTYNVRIVKICDYKGQVIATGKDIRTQDYINTDTSGTYILSAESTNYSGNVSVNKTLNVFVLEGLCKHTEARFISEEFIDTVSPFSIWKEDLYDELEKSLSASDDSYVYKVDLTYDELNNIKGEVAKKNYKISRLLNKKIINKIK